mgnify:CR=1 FL=1
MAITRVGHSKERYDRVKWWLFSEKELPEKLFIQRGKGRATNNGEVLDGVADIEHSTKTSTKVKV